MSREPTSALIPTVVQDARTGEVLMLAWSDAESRRRTLADGQVWFYSRSRQQLWHKGATSGNTMQLVEARLDCDGDTLLYRVTPSGPACHTGHRTCFHNLLTGLPDAATEISIDELFEVVSGRRTSSPASSYTARLLSEGLLAINAKIHEEALEVIEATGDRQHLIEELADLTYHVLVLMAALDIPPQAVRLALGRRRASSD